MVIERVEQAVKELIRDGVPEEDTADVAGRIRFVEKQLADYRRGMVAEVGPQDGTEYRIIEKRTAKRIYNDEAILFDTLASTDVPLPVLLRDMIDAGVIRLTWGWTALKAWFQTRNMTLRVGGSVTDLDGPHVAEEWTSRLEVVGRE